MWEAKLIRKKEELFCEQANLNMSRPPILEKIKLHLKLE